MENIVSRIAEHADAAAGFLVDAVFFGVLPLVLVVAVTVVILSALRPAPDDPAAPAADAPASGPGADAPATGSTAAGAGPSAPFSRSERLLAGAFSGLGAMVGIAMGASRLGVVGSILPALLTLISGYLVYLFTADRIIVNRRILPYCLMALIVSASFGSFYGAAIRGQQEQNARDWEKHMIEFREIQVPLKKEKLRREMFPGTPEPAAPGGKAGR